MNIQPVLEAIQQSVYSHGAKEIAADLGHSFEYLRKIVNPDPDPDEERHIQLRSFIRIIELTGDVKALDLIAASLGYRLMPMGGEPDGEDMNEEIIQAYEASAAFLREANNKAPYTRLIELRRKLAKEADDVIKRRRNEDHAAMAAGAGMEAVQ